MNQFLLLLLLLRTLPHSASICNVTVLKRYISTMASSATQTCSTLKQDLNEWHFSPSLLMRLPLDKIKENSVRRNVKDAIFSEVSPTPLKTPLKLVAYAEDALINALDMDPSVTSKPEFVEFASGNKVLNSSTPLAHRYGGYQFGIWAMQLGDGRAHLLGEYVNRAGKRWEVQLKGSGKTPYSRDGDGRAVLRSSIREFLCSEAMYHLGVPTSRAVAIVASDDYVLRDMFYNGFPRPEKTAVVLRLAPSWFRFGSLEILSKNREYATMKSLLNFIISEHFPEINVMNPEKYIQFYTLVAQRTINLTAKWQSIGFTHGVLNTDNMSLIGITIDYGPFGFMETYDSKFTPNSSDEEGRYCYEKQREIVIWNLEKLADALRPVLSRGELYQLEEILMKLPLYQRQRITAVFRSKLGLRDDMEVDEQMLSLLLQMMEDHGGDFTQTFRQLSEIPIQDLESRSALKKYWSLKRLYKHEHYPAFAELYKKRVEREYGLDSDEERRTRMCNINPRYVLRNWMAQKAIEKAEKGDFSEVNFLLKVLQNPFAYNEEAEDKGYSKPPPAWSFDLKVSCSS